MRISLGGAEWDVAVDYRITEGDLVFFIHGLGCSRKSFRDVWHQDDFAELSLMALDLVGFGDSTRSPDFSYTMEDQARICDALLEMFPERPLHIVAHSMGGAVGLLIPSARLEKALSFNNIEGNLIGEDCGMLSRKTIGISYEEFEKDYFPYLKTRFQEELKGKVFMDQTTPLAFYKSSESLVSWSDSGWLLKRFKSLPGRTSYFYGTESANPKVLEAIEDLYRESIAQTGHFVMNDDPNRFYDKLYHRLPLRS